MEKVHKKGNSGFYLYDSGVITFDVQGVALRDQIAEKEYRDLYSRFLMENKTLKMGDFTVPIWGEGHNLYPQELQETLSDNKLLPEIMQKQVEFLFGKGPYLYRHEIVGSGKEARVIRTPVQDTKIYAWLESWESRGLAHYWDYLIDLIEDFYHTHSAISQYHLSKARRLQGIGLPVQALSHIDSTTARKASLKQISANRVLTDKDCDHIIVGNWLLPNMEFDIYHRFNPMKPFKYDTSVSWVSDKTFGKDIYPYSRWFKGLKDWIVGSNLTPRYINSYLKNALNAHVHVVIPGGWYMRQKEILETICRENHMNGNVDQAYYKGVKMTDNAGNPIEFRETMMDELIAYQLKQITNLLSGEGENQGKLWASTKWGEEGWEFKEFPGKFKEYMDAVITYDKRADQVILAGKGINASITNVEQDGLISKSGSDVLYNYMLYANSLTIAEFYITKDINRAIRMNFPYTIQQDIKLGFRLEIPAKQQETTPSDRMESTANS